MPEWFKPAGKVLGPVRQRALRESVFEVLLLAIVRGEVPGAWSNHKLLAEQMHVSVTPLREALQELAACGIVENQHNRGTKLRPFGRPQLLEIFHVRALLEAEATRLACPRIDQAALAKLQTQINSLMARESANWNTEVIAKDENLHDLIAATCGKPTAKGGDFPLPDRAGLHSPGGRRLPLPFHTGFARAPCGYRGAAAPTTGRSRKGHDPSYFERGENMQRRAVFPEAKT